MKAYRVLLAALVIASVESASARQIARETVVINKTTTSDTGFSIQWVADGIKVAASSLDGNGLYEGIYLKGMKDEVTPENAEVALDDLDHEVRSEDTDESEHVFRLSYEEMRCALVVITYNVGNKGGVETRRQYIFPVSLFLKTNASRGAEATCRSAIPPAAAGDSASRARGSP